MEISSKTRKRGASLVRTSRSMPLDSITSAETAERAEGRHLPVHARRALGQGDPPHDRVARDAHQRQLAGHVRGGPVRADDRRAERPLTPPADADR